MVGDPNSGLVRLQSKCLTHREPSLLPSGLLECLYAVSLINFSISYVTRFFLCFWIPGHRIENSRVSYMAHLKCGV